jgi:hypothetical protein
MPHCARFAVLVLVVSLYSFIEPALEPACADTPGRTPLEVIDYRISDTASPEGTASVDFVAETFGSGTYLTKLHLSPGMGMVFEEDRGGRTSSGGNALRESWQVIVPKSGLFMLEIGVVYRQLDGDASGDRFFPVSSFPLYFEMKDGRVDGKAEYVVGMVQMFCGVDGVDLFSGNDQLL